MIFFDTHCHFDFADFHNDRELVWRECCDLGVTQLIIPGVAVEQWSAASTIAQQHEKIYWGAGLHPWWISKNEDVSKLYNLLSNNISHPKCIAIGECGLDLSIETSLSMQQQVLDIHLRLAQETSVPLIIHCHKAYNELLVQLKKYKLTAGGVIHAFSGSYEMAAQYWAMGFRLGIGGTITYERANKTRQAVKKLPLESLLLETDAPDMPLSGKQGARNSPENIPFIAQVLAELRGEPVEDIARQTTQNAQQLFKIIL